MRRPAAFFGLMRMSAAVGAFFDPSELGTTSQLLRYENSSCTDETGAKGRQVCPDKNLDPLNVAASSGMVEYVEWPCKIGCIIRSYPTLSEPSMRIVNWNVERPAIDSPKNHSESNIYSI